jgi:hypothetical protein
MIELLVAGMAGIAVVCASSLLLLRSQRQRHAVRELRLQRALGFYARETNWQRYTENLPGKGRTWSNSLVSIDRGRTAREALAEHHGITVDELVARNLARAAAATTKHPPGGSGSSPADRPSRPAGPSSEPAS